MCGVWRVCVENCDFRPTGHRKVNVSGLRRLSVSVKISYNTSFGCFRILL